jgi:ABC-type bacteriocin/lantibiotic exporter with double-glycine peptidase domain
LEEDAHVQVAAAPAKEKGETALPAAYTNYLTELSSAWTDIPELSITYEKLAYQIKVPPVHQHQKIGTLWTGFRDGLVHLIPKSIRQETAEDEQITFHPLHPVDGVVRPGELTIVLAPAGHGKSVLLKSLAGRLARDKDSAQGEVQWNGRSAAESVAAGQQLVKLCAFVEQGDVRQQIH